MGLLVDMNGERKTEMPESGKKAPGSAGRAVYFLIAAFYVLLYYFVQILSSFVLLTIAVNRAAKVVGQTSGDEYQDFVNSFTERYSDTASIIAGVLCIALCVLVFPLYRRLSGDGSLSAKSFFALRLPKARHALLALAIGAAAYHFVALYLNLCGKLFPSAFESYDNASQSITSESLVAVNLILLVIVTPLCEELIFRNRLIDSFSGAGIGPVFSVLLSSLIFGVAHGNPVWIIYAFTIGCIFGFMYTSSGSLMTGVIAHAVFNLFGFAYGKLSTAEMTEGARSAVNVFYTVFLYFSPVLLAGLLFLFFGTPFIRRGKKEKRNCKPHTGSTDTDN